MHERRLSRTARIEHAYWSKRSSTARRNRIFFVLSTDVRLCAAWPKAAPLVILSQSALESPRPMERVGDVRRA
eukprot:3392591-Pleurochrysis_carterae.AAC.3